MLAAFSYFYIALHRRLPEFFAFFQINQYCKSNRQQMKPNLSYFSAIPEDAQWLSATAFQSKKNWGYDDELMRLWKDDLEITAAYILKNNVVKVFDGQTFLGFFAIKMTDSENAELDHLWLTPENMRKHYGSIIFHKIISDLEAIGCKNMTLTAEPNAVRFYDKMGGIVVGKFQSKVSGRLLDVYAFLVN